MTKPLKATQSNPRQGGPSFAISNRLFRALWNIVWRLFGIWTPAPLHAWRRTLLKIFGAKIASTAKVYPGVKIWHPANLEMDEFSCLGPGAICYSMARISLGAYALVSQRAHLCSGSHRIDDPSFQLIAKPIHIAANAWVAAEAFVGPGVTLGEGAVLGARGCAFRDLEPWTVWVGNPAVYRRKRDHSPETNFET